VSWAAFRVLTGAVSAFVFIAISGCSNSVASRQATVPDASRSMLTSTPQTSLPDMGPRNAAKISPCDDLAAADITALGLDPATKRKTDLKEQVVGERGCRWTGRDVLVDVMQPTRGGDVQDSYRLG